jgi:hypothetical protein
MSTLRFPDPQELRPACSANWYMLRAHVVMDDGTIVRPDWYTSQLAVWYGQGPEVTQERIEAARMARQLWGSQ